MISDFDTVEYRNIPNVYQNVLFDYILFVRVLSKMKGDISEITSVLISSMKNTLVYVSVA